MKSTLFVRMQVQDREVLLVIRSESSRLITDAETIAGQLQEHGWIVLAGDVDVQALPL